MGWLEAARWNFVLGTLENAVIVFCTWYFVSHIGANATKRPAVKIAAFLGYGLSIQWITFYFPNTGYTGLGRLVLMIAVSVCIGYFLYSSRGRYLFYYFLFPVSIYAVQILIEYLSYSYNIARWGAFAFDYYNNNVALTARILILLLLTGAWVLLIDRNRYQNVTRLQYAGLFLPPLFSIFIIASLIMLGNVYSQMYGVFLIVVNIILLVIINVYILYLFSYLSRNRKLKNELDILRRHREMQFEYYESLERKYQSSRQMVHDMRNHMQAMESLIKEEENGAARSYAGDIYETLHALGRVQYTGNRMLNIILNDKAEQAKALGISMDIEVGGIQLQHMKDIDITTVFANLLDNAIEAAVQAAGVKYIKIRAGSFREFSVIKIQNSMTARTAAGEKTLKKQGHMGIGLENVKMTLDKYGGGIQIIKAEQEYKVSITIPNDMLMNKEGCVSYEKEM